MAVLLSQNVRIAGVEQLAGATLNLSQSEEADLVRRGLATWVGSNRAAGWVNAPHLLRVAVSGVGTIQIDSRNRAGEETTAVALYSVNSAQEEIRFPFPGLDSTEIRITTTGTAKCEVLI